MQRLFDDGTLPQTAFDVEALTALRSLTADLQDKVLDHLESERVFLMNSRSKSGFLVSACDRARGGALDVRGMGLQDPWRPQLLAMATPKRPQVELLLEGQWLKQHGAKPARIVIDVTADHEIGVQRVVLSLALTQSVAGVKERLATIGVRIPVHKMKLKEATVGFLKDSRTLAFYNLCSGSLLQLECRTRGGVALRHDHSQPPRCR